MGATDLCSRYVFAVFESSEYLELFLLFLQGIEELTQNDEGNVNAFAIYLENTGEYVCS